MTKKSKKLSLKLEMQQVIMDWERSGLTQGEFASHLGISVYKFKYWKGRLRDERKSSSMQSGFVPIEVIPPSMDHNNSFTIHFPNGVTIETRQSPSTHQIVELIKSF